MNEAQSMNTGDRQASLLDKILNGANAGEPPFERPAAF
jgi:hypothetical protein